MKSRFAILAAGLVAGAFVAVPAQAQPESDDDAVVRVVNYHPSDVRVYVFDADGRRQLLGTVRRGGYRELPLPDRMIADGFVQVKAYPVSRPAGLGAPAEGEYGVRSNNLYLAAGDVVDFWLEPRLEASMVRLTRS